MTFQSPIFERLPLEPQFLNLSGIAVAIRPSEILGIWLQHFSIGLYWPGLELLIQSFTVTFLEGISSLWIFSLVRTFSHQSFEIK